eukprot:Ihof_evm1s453 gene=Ihof_evmTU1s453
MADRKAVNKYYPPDWDPSKGSINTYQNSHPLRDRARKLDQGILIVRFELPYNIWCNGCDKMVGMGVRYNAEKKEVGKYYSTPILSFRMKCHLCDNWFEIRTDPKNTQYVVVSGARRKNEEWEPADNEGISLEDTEESTKRSQDPMYRLEHGLQDKTKGEEKASGLARLQRLAERGRDDYELNKLLRKDNREYRREVAVARADEQEVQRKYQLAIPILPANEEDAISATFMIHQRDGSRRDTLKRRLAIQAQPVLIGSREGSKTLGTGFGSTSKRRKTTLAGLVRPKPS